jgi:hypothetical protein
MTDDGFSTYIRCRMTASLRATATFALRNPLRFASLTPQALSADHFATRVSYGSIPELPHV